MDVVARLRFLRISPRKVRLVLDLIRGKQLAAAERQLEHLPKASARPLLKLLRSAQANAENNFKLEPKTLYVKQAYANEGPKLKRYRPRAMGRAALIQKRSSHVTIILSTPVGSEKTKQGEKPIRGQKNIPPSSRPAPKHEDKKKRES